ncbi:Gustatory receptor 33, partial [Halyomorpha halys]
MSTTSRPSLYQRFLDRMSLEKYTELVFFLAAAIGISPLVFVNGKPRISFSLLIYSILFIFTILYCTVSYIWIIPPNIPIRFHRNLFVASNLIFTFQPIVYFSTCVLSFRKLNNIRNCLSSVDSSLRSAGICVGKKIPQKMLYFLLLFAIFVALCLPYYPFLAKLGLLRYLNYMLASGQYSALGLEFSYHLRRIVRCLRRMKGRTDQTGQAERLVLLSKAHHQLCSSIEEFSSCYGFQVLYILIIQFLSFTLIFFYFLFNHLSISYWIIHGFLFTTLPFLITSVMMIDCSAKISEKTKEVNLLLYHLMIKDKSYELLNN